MCFIHDLPLLIKGTNLLLFADDTVYETDALLQSLLLYSTRAQSQINNWFVINELTVNDNKTQEIVFTLSKSLAIYKPVKLLGVFLDYALAWEAHADYITTKLSKQLYLFRRLVYAVCWPPWPRR